MRGEGAVPYDGIIGTIDAAFALKDDSGGELCLFDNLGNVFTKDLVETGCDSITASGATNEWIAKDGSSILALVDLSGANAGRVQIKGTLNEEGSPSDSHVFYIENASSQTIASIDSSGNLHLAGRRHTDWW